MSDGASSVTMSNSVLIRRCIVKMALSLICLTVALFRVIIGQSCDVSQYCTQTAVLIVRYILTRVETGNWDALVGGGFVMRYVEGPSRQGVLIAQGGGREKNSVSATGWIVERRLVNHDSHLRWTPELARACHAFYPCHHPQHAPGRT